MDGTHYSSNVINGTSTPSYPSSAASTPQNLQPHTLPPLQHQQHPQHHQQQGNGIMQTGTPYGSYPHTPRTPATPNTPGPAMNNYPPPPSTNGGRGSYQMMPGQYQQPHPNYAPTTSAMLPQTTTSMAHPQPIAPAPAPGNRGPPILRPMPANGVMPQQGMQSPYAQSPMMPQTMLPDNEQPTHVVGSQGRRGILPSAPGRPAPPAAGTVTKNQIPQKDADGKFPCPHCTKTYLHAKHLKRHLLRHTGDRPYMCVLCRDTFSRSDILKRHFQKCSIRRGNPTGVSHLSHPHAHVKKSQQQQKHLAEAGDMNHMNGMGNVQGDGMVHPFGLIPAQADGLANNIQNDQSQISRSNSMSRIDPATTDPNQRNAANGPARGVTNGGAQGAPGAAQGAQAYDQSAAYNSAGMNPQLANYNMSTGQNGMPMFAGQNPNPQSGGLDWSSMFQAGAHTHPHPSSTFVIQSSPANSGQTQNATRLEPNSPCIGDADLQAEGGHDDKIPSGQSFYYGLWGPLQAQDPFQRLSIQILTFIQSSNFSADPTVAATMRMFFSPENVKTFLDMYIHFHVHFPVLHVPTFSLLEAYTGLLSAMVCIGACYAKTFAPSQVREMTDVVYAALRSQSHMLSALPTATADNLTVDLKYEDGSFAGNARDVEELQAIMLMLMLLCWNGTPEQRERGREIHPLLALLSRKANLTRVSSNASSPMLPFSPLHQPNFDLSNGTPFDWRAWVDQEKRIRIMHSILTCDAAFTLYFNSPPAFDPLEVSIPLPADDAAWEADDATECAEALGLHGPELCYQRNRDGTQRVRQPEINLVLQTLLHPSYQIQTGTTNLYGKFLIIHSLLALLRRAQSEGNVAIGGGTPLSQFDWVNNAKDTYSTVKSLDGSSNSNGSGTATESLISPQTAQAFTTALDKFKWNWDVDMANQFQPSSTNPRRQGFSRDGIHYYWLGKYLLQNTKASHLELPSDQRFCQVIHLLKSLKSWVMSDGAKRGEELGSIGDIDSGYGSMDLTLDFVNLFTPLPKIVERAPAFSSVKMESYESKTGGGGMM
ncbi:hypothetical protein SEUCBS140593_007575 [Sporothrix eucalyptigena]|uniref:C2H2-type domain-containing protein n=1 Tax=Sporothrix eucalyptigena TaxID=1812306 RepID=A0ABP0CE86_9PEZI